MRAIVGKKAPALEIETWVQGEATDLDRERGSVVLVEVFQVNCPGCFLYGIPLAIDLHRAYGQRGLTVLGLATAFEDFDKNTLKNLRLLVEEGRVIGETLAMLGRYSQLEGDRLLYAIPFPVAMDRLEKISKDEDIDAAALDFIRSRIQDFDRQPQAAKAAMIEKVKQYLQNKRYSAVTFEHYGLDGTPSQILVDRQGILRQVSFGRDDNLEAKIVALLKES